MSNPPCAHARNLSLLSGIRHGFFGRQGGVSTGLYASLNVGTGSGDDGLCVRNNRDRIKNGIGADHLLSCKQRHTARVVSVNRPWTSGSCPLADAMVTQQPGFALCVLSADCVPVLFADPHAAIIGAAHAGWKGALGGVCEATIEAMIALGATRTRITAAIGPAIAQPSYEVGSDFYTAFTDKQAWSADLFKRRKAHIYFDLPAYVHKVLIRAGLCDIERLDHDTYVMQTDYFSCRYCKHHGHDDYGRNGSVIMLENVSAAKTAGR